MPYCPECRYEYVPEITTCPDCRVPLVDQLSSEDAPSMVAVGAFIYEVEAQSAKLKLESRGIESVLTNETMAGVDIAMAYAQGGIQLVVNKVDAARAIEILEADDEVVAEN